MTVAAPPVHPAKFSAPILTEMQRALDHHGHGLRVLDPFAGVGLIHTLEGHKTIGVEIEPEWANVHPRTIVGDALLLPFAAGSFDAVATSPTYGNRMADQYDGRDGSRRYTYRTALDRPLHPRNTARLQWGPGYWHRHWSAWCEARRVLRPGGVFVLNVSDHVRKGETIEVVAWHRARLLDLGFMLASDEDVSTPRMGHGANREARADAEHVMTFQLPRS